ncbi:MAG: CHAT domain-containing tetratricopeptide repeat protein [Isosphaeraceae bacterium]
MRSIMGLPRLVVMYGVLIGSLHQSVITSTIARAGALYFSSSPSSAARKLEGEDARRASDLDKAIVAAIKADRWDEATAKGEELLALRIRVQGQSHFETINTEWRLRSLRRIAAMPTADRAEFQAAQSMDEQAKGLEKAAKYARALALFEKALEIRRRLLTEDHPDTAESCDNVAGNLMELGKYHLALPLAEKSLEIRRRTLTDDHPETATSYLNLAGVLDAQGKYARAQPLLEKALEISRRLLTDDHTVTASCFNGLAVNLKQQAKYAQAQPLYEKALEIRRRLLTEDHLDTATSYNNLAMILNAQGKYALAHPLFEKSLEIRRRLFGEEDPRTAFGYNRVGFNLQAQSKFAEAQPFFARALEIRRRTLTDDHPYTANSYNDLATNLSSQGENALALPYYQKALEINRRLLTDENPRTVTYYNNVAFCLNELRRYEEAEPLCEKGLEIRRKLLGDEHPSTAISYNNLAYNLIEQGKYARAQRLYERVLEIRLRQLGDEHPFTADGYDCLARTLHAQGKYREALDYWQKGVRSLDQSRLRIAFGGMDRAGAVNNTMRPAMAAVLARLGQPEEAWQALEENLGRGLLDELVARQDRRLSPADRARIRDLTRELEAFDSLTETVSRGPESAERARQLDDLRRRRDQASIALGEFQSKLFRDYGPLAGRVATLSEVQRAVPADAALIAWVDVAAVGPGDADPDGEHWAVVIRSRGVPVWIPMAGTGQDGLWTRDDVALADRLRRALRAPVGATAHLKQLVEGLRAQRIEPLSKALCASAEDQPAVRRLIILPSSSMAGVPVEVLLAPDDTRTVCYVPSASVFKYLREQPSPGRHAGLLALGDPVCSSPLPGSRYEVEAIARIFQSDQRPTRSLLGADASEATLHSISASGELSRYGFVHLATHGVIDQDIPARSAVILTQTGLPDPAEPAGTHQPAFDGRLLVREIQRGWEMKADLVTLSACETALGRKAGGEGFVGFTQALLMSGSRSVCLSLWMVDDMVTALLMQRFYANLLGRRPGLDRPMPKAEALHEAKVWLRELPRAEALSLIIGLAGDEKSGKSYDFLRRHADAMAELRADGERPYASPQFWAAFVLSGAPD